MPVMGVSPIFGVFELIKMKSTSRQTFSNSQESSSEHAFDLHCEFYKDEVIIDDK